MATGRRVAIMSLRDSQETHWFLRARGLPWLTPGHIIRNVVRACVIRLRDIGGVDFPERLVCKAWSYPDYRDEIPEEERSVGTDALDLPTLGLQRERA